MPLSGQPAHRSTDQLTIYHSGLQFPFEPYLLPFTFARLHLGRHAVPTLPMSGGSEFEMKSDLPGYPFGSSPRALIAGKGPFHPSFKG